MIILFSHLFNHSRLRRTIQIYNFLLYPRSIVTSVADDVFRARLYMLLYFFSHYAGPNFRSDTYTLYNTNAVIVDLQYKAHDPEHRKCYICHFTGKVLTSFVRKNNLPDDLTNAYVIMSQAADLYDWIGPEQQLRVVSHYALPYPTQPYSTIPYPYPTLTYSTLHFTKLSQHTLYFYLMYLILLLLIIRVQFVLSSSGFPCKEERMYEGNVTNVKVHLIIGIIYGAPHKWGTSGNNYFLRAIQA